MNEHICKKDYPNVLIISHNLYDTSNNIGKTLVSLFRNWPKERISQVYFRNDKPSFQYCNNYYCITDKDIIKALFSLGFKRAGRIIKDEKNLRLSTTEQKMYQLGNRRKPYISLIRDWVWGLSLWKSQRLQQWLEEVKPDIILFVPNDYCLAYQIAIYIQKKINKPIVPYYMDDSFYFDCSMSVIDKFRRNRLRKLAASIHSYSSKIFTICEYMSDEYSAYFNLPCYEFVNSVNLGNVIDTKDNSENIVLSYIGNLHSNRWKSLIEIGQAVETIMKQRKINVELRIYSASDIEDEVINSFNKISTIKFMGALTSQQVYNKQLEADILIHVESFDKECINSTRLSLSTKIPEYLNSNRCIFAYGPENIASMRYLKEYRLGQVCTSKNQLENQLEELLFSSDIRGQYAKNGIERVKDFHNSVTVSKRFQKLIMENLKKI